MSTEPENQNQEPQPTLQELLAELQAKQAAEAEQRRQEAELQQRAAADPNLDLEIKLQQRDVTLRQAINAQNAVVEEVREAIQKGEIDPKDGKVLIDQVSGLDGAALVQAVKEGAHRVNLDALRYRYAQTNGRLPSQVPTDPALTGAAGGSPVLMDAHAEEFFKKLGIKPERVPELVTELKNV